MCARCLGGDEGLFLESQSSRQDEVGREVIRELATFDLDIHEGTHRAETMRMNGTVGVTAGCEFGKHLC